MTEFHAKGTCTVEGCGRFSSAVGADKEDARLLLIHDHGDEYKHAFEGEIKVIVIDGQHSQR